LSAGAENSTFSLPPDRGAVIPRINGAPEVVDGVEEMVFEDSPAPIALMALIRTATAVPLTRPPTIKGDVVETGLRGTHRPPFSEYS
jgi:hypothetical protein